MPAHHNLEAYLDAYIKAAVIGEDGKSPLFRSAAGRTDMCRRSQSSGLVLANGADSCSD
jgi:hypothetical protein